MQNIAVLVGLAVLAWYAKDWLANKNWASLFSSFMPAKTDTTNSVVNVVGSWETLRALCKNQGRLEALAKLDEMFPLLNKVEEPKKVV